MRDDTRALVVFFVTAFCWAWAVFIPLAYFRGPMEWTILATMAPTVAVLVAQWTVAGNLRAVRLWTGWLRVFGASAIGVALIVLAFVVFPVVTTTDPRPLHWSILLSTSVFNYSTLLGGPLFEEPGWRGFALPRLEARFHPVVASVVLSVVWAAWHLPLFFYPGWSSASPLQYLAIVVGAGVLLAFGANLARFAVVTPILMHAMFNTASRYLSGLFSGLSVQPHTPIPFAMVMALCGLATAGLLAAITRGRLAYRNGLSSLHADYVEDRG